MAHGNPFRRTAWLHSWWDHYGDGRELFVLHVTDSNGRIVGIAPWFLETTVRLGRVIRAMGCGEVCSEYLGILVTPEYEQPVCRALAQWLAQAAAGHCQPEDRWDLLMLSGVDQRDATAARFIRHLETVGNRVHSHAASNCWRLRLPASWDELLMTLSKTRRKSIRRIERQYLQGERTRLHLVSQPDQVVQGMRVLVELHQRRRNSLGQPGCFASPAFDGFLHQAAEKLLDHELLKLYWLELEGSLVAAEFSLADGDTVYSYQGGIDPDALEHAPGFILQIATIKEAIKTGYLAYDFLRGDEPYKAHWRAEPSRNVDYRVVPRRTSAQLRHQVWAAGDTMKHWIKAGLHLTGVL